jgi:hypothetical protein
MELQSDALNQMEYVMRRKKPKRQPDRSPAPDKRKISQMIWEYAGDFIRMGGTPEERQSLLNAACSAWNIACDPPERRKANLDRYMVEYRRYNTDADEAQMAGVRSNMEKLVEKKGRCSPLTCGRSWAQESCARGTRIASKWHRQRFRDDERERSGNRPCVRCR